MRKANIQIKKRILKKKANIYDILGINETDSWSNNKRRMRNLPLIRQCGYQKRKKNIRLEKYKKHKIELFDYITLYIEEEMDKNIDRF